MPVRLFRHDGHAASVNPAIVEVEKRADGNRVIDGFVCPADTMEKLYIFGPDLGGLLVHLRHESEQGFLFLEK